MNTDTNRSAPARFIVGIDLGTTNSAVAYVDTKSGDRQISIFSVLQFVASAEVEGRETLPSFHYAPAAGEFSGMRLPWQTEDPKYVVGIFARDHGATAPGRLVVSAKSWLSHSGVDRTAPLLPWHGSPDVEKLSPMEVSARYLAHVRSAWNFRFPDEPLEKQDVTITIPASFDEVARELTVAAAQRAGIPRLVLLEEPQAAFYAWIHAHGQDWNQKLQPGQRILVCDIGGGTTDFTLIQVRPGEKGEVRFHRFAVGDHLILGGDNLDLALAHHLEPRLAGGGKLDPRTWSILVRRCQQVKERLLGTAPPEQMTVNVPRAGARLIGASLTVDVTHDEVVELLVNGFLPRVGLDEKPAKRTSGFQEFGLPFAPDPAITRYLAAFLTAHRNADAGQNADGTPDSARPDIVLFNGGLFESPQMRLRLLEVIRSWFNPPDSAETWSPIVLENERLDLAVAVGAAYYGMVRRGFGVRISGGLARSYYIGVQQDHSRLALCLVPAGLEEGQEIHLEKEFQLLIRQPVEFPLFISSARTTDPVGQLVPIDPLQLSELPPIRTVLRAGKKTAEAETVSVHLHARLSEIGTLEVWCSEVRGPRKWKLQFDVRAATQTDVTAHSGAGEQAGFVDETTTNECIEFIRRTFQPHADPLAPEQLVKSIERQTGMARLEWPPSLLRRFWEALLDCEEGRKRSVAHEARWLSLTGFSLRPGYGIAVDDWRVAQTWRLFDNKVQHPNNELCRAEWWILWRRIAGGLVPGQQRILADPLIAAMRARARSEQQSKPSARAKQSSAAPFKFGPHETQEVWRLLGSLELLNPDLKIELGDLLLDLLSRKGFGVAGGAAAWALGRLGARVPMYGPLNTLVPAETAERWLARALTLPAEAETALFAVMQIARRTNDRYRDIAEPIREQAVSWLSSNRAPAHYIDLVRQGGELLRDEQDQMFGESLPPGLRV